MINQLKYCPSNMGSFSDWSWDMTDAYKIMHKYGGGRESSFSSSLTTHKSGEGN